MSGDPPAAGGTGRWRAFSELMLVARREVAVRTRSTAYRLTTVILLIATVAGIAVTAELTGRPQRFTVAVATQGPPGTVVAVRAGAKAAGLAVTVVPFGGRAAALRKIEQGKVNAAVTAAGEIVWKSSPDSALNPVLNAAVRQALLTERAASLGLSARAIAALLAPVRVRVTQLHSQSQRTAKTIVAYAGMILLFMAISVYGGYVLTGVVEEKASRVVEVLLSRMPPSSLLGGKIVGIGLIGLAQFAAVAIAAVATLLVTRPSGLPPGTYGAIPALVGWFVLGYVFYSMLYGSLGSRASRTEDAQAAASPVIVLLLGIYVLAITAMANPHAGWVTVMSMLPPSAPMLMPLRVSLVTVPAWQIVLAVTLLLAGTYGLMRAGARLYRNSVLRTGPRLRLREAWRSGSAQPVPGRP